MTGAEFARHAAYLSKNAAEWAGEILSMPEDVTADVDLDRVQRFLDDMRERLNHIETMGGLSDKK